MIAEVHETFWTLLKDSAHWEFELFLMLLFDVLIGVLIWPRLRARLHRQIDEEHGFEHGGPIPSPVSLALEAQRLRNSQELKKVKHPDDCTICAAKEHV